MVAQFPQELVNCILEFLHDDPASLLEAARVCRRWSTPIPDILCRSTICVVPVGTYRDDWVKPPSRILWTSSVLAVIAERPHLALRMEKISIWMSTTYEYDYELDWNPYTYPYGYKETYEFVHQLSMLLPRLPSLKHLKMHATESDSLKRTESVLDVIRGCNTYLLEELELVLYELPFHIMDILHGTTIKILSLETSIFNKHPMRCDPSTATPSSLTHLNMPRTPKEAVINIFKIITKTPHLLPHLQRVSFHFETVRYHKIIQALPMSTHEFKIVVTAKAPTYYLYRYQDSCQLDIPWSRAINNANGSPDTQYEATFDFQQAQRQRGVERLSLRYEFTDEPRPQLLIEVLGAWAKSVESLVSRGHSMQRVILAFPRFDITSAEVANARKVFEDVLIQFRLDVSVEEAAESEESIRAAFPGLDNAGLLVVGSIA